MATLTAILTCFWGTKNVVGLFIGTFPYFGFVNGYTAAKLYAFFNQASWGRLATLATLFYPISLFAGYFLIDWIDPSYAERLFGEEGVSASTFCYLWLFLHLPGTILGAYQGFVAEKPEVPTKQSRLFREIPTCNINTRRCRTFCASLLPFIAIYLQFG